MFAYLFYASRIVHLSRSAGSMCVSHCWSAVCSVGHSFSALMWLPSHLMELQYGYGETRIPTPDWSILVAGSLSTNFPHCFDSLAYFIVLTSMQCNHRFYANRGTARAHKIDRWLKCSKIFTKLGNLVVNVSLPGEVTWLDTAILYGFWYPETTTAASPWFSCYCVLDRAERYVCRRKLEMSTIFVRFNRFVSCVAYKFSGL